MSQLQFKNGPYKYYAPWIYKLTRLRARYDLWQWDIDKGMLDVLAQHYWDNFLACKFEQELVSRGYKVGTENIQPHKHSNAFILGCGASINQVNALQWGNIENYFSIGLNNFYVHPFTPNVYFCEFVDNIEFLELIYSQLLNNVDREKTTVYISGRYILFHGHGYIKPQVITPSFYVTRNIRTSSGGLLSKLLVKHYEGHSSSLSHHISNLDTAIHYAVKQGFKDIHLVGVDLTSDGYFWDYEESPVYQKARNFICSFQNQTKYQKDNNGRHATASKEVAERLGKITIVEYLELLQTQILTPKGIQLWVCNSESLLANVLPVKDLSEIQIT